MSIQKPFFNKRFQLIIIIAIVASISSIFSHGMIAWLGIETTYGNHVVIGAETSNHSVFFAGSSLAGDGLSLRRIADELNKQIEGWGVAGSSPSEWEQFQNLPMQTRLAVIVVSIYDLNEYFLSDFRAEIVPLAQTIKDIRQSGAEWLFSKRLLSLYPLSYVRKIFPTVGRSSGVMVGVREKLKKFVRLVIPIESEAGPTLSINENDSTNDYKKEKISSWSSGRMLSRLDGIRSASQGKHTFNGPKKLAFFRMLYQANKKGQVIVVVLPISPTYADSFLSSEVEREFEVTLSEAKHKVPEVRWIRLDRLNELNSNEYFWDLVHMNIQGQKIATEAFLGHLRKF